MRSSISDGIERDFALNMIGHRSSCPDLGRAGGRCKAHPGLAALPPRRATVSDMVRAEHRLLHARLVARSSSLRASSCLASQRVWLRLLRGELAAPPASRSSGTRMTGFDHCFQRTSGMAICACGFDKLGASSGVQAQPCHAVQNGLCSLFGGAFFVCIFNA